MKQHECVIGIFYDYEDTRLVSFEDLKEAVEMEYRAALDKYKEEYKIENYLDRRKSTNFTHFDFCPICGRRINWAKLRKEVQQ